MDPTTSDDRPGRPLFKKRKIRKGTQSCWECKRRKVRCTFHEPADVCDGCKSRKVPCIGQEFPCEAVTGTSAASKRAPANVLVEKLAKEARQSHSAPIVPTSISMVSPKPNSQVDPGQEHQHARVCDALRAIWPSQLDLDIITSVSVSTSAFFHGLICMPYSSLLGQDLPSPKEILRLLPTDSHPVLIARKLLLLGSFLQAIPPGAVKQLGDFAATYPQLMDKLVGAACRLVTSQDDLVGSLEGIECIMMEGMYHNNAGNLRRACLTTRRAIAIAQMLGLHKDGSRTYARMLEAQTRERIEPAYMWMRLVTSDRYLSLILGLPQASLDNSFAALKGLHDCPSVERMERIHTVVCGHILQRNQSDLHNMDMTHKIDQQLQDAAASVPAQWWLMPDLASTGGSELEKTTRMTNQFVHYHLLAQLHLPYLLQSSNDRAYDYSKLTAVNSSREVLTRFVALRTLENLAVYCRGVDFLAFIASITMCLAHIDARRQSFMKMGARHVSVFQFLAHQRPNDRGLMERTLQSFERMAETSDDAISSRIFHLLGRLLAVENAAVEGHTYETSLSPGASELSDEATHETGEVLNIHIPHFGTVKIERSGSLEYIDLAHTLLTSAPMMGNLSRSTEEQSLSDMLNTRIGAGTIGLHSAPESVQGHVSDDNLFLLPGFTSDIDETLQGVDMALFDSFLRGAEDVNQWRS